MVDVTEEAWTALKSCLERRSRELHEAVRARIRARNPGAKRSTWDSMPSVMSALDPLGTWQ